MDSLRVEAALSTVVLGFIVIVGVCPPVRVEWLALSGRVRFENGAKRVCPVVSYRRAVLIHPVSKGASLFSYIRCVTVRASDEVHDI